MRRALLKVSCAMLVIGVVTPGAAGGRVLTPMDVVSIRLPDHPDMDTTTRIAPDGTVNLAYVGRIRAAGLTEDALARFIEKRLIELGILAHP